MILLKKYSDDNISGLIESMYVVDEDFIISSFEFPSYIVGGEKNQKLELLKIDNAFFDDSRVKKVFDSDSVGGVYTTKGYQEDYVDVLDEHAFYLKAPDGTARVYSFKPSIIGENGILEIIWNNGDKNKSEYIYRDGTLNCGETSYFSVVSKDIVDVKNDLEVIGKGVNNEEVFELKDKHNDIMEELFNGISQRDGKILTYEEFTSEHPIIFWIDPFSRLIKLVNKRFYPEGYCLG